MSDAMGSWDDTKIIDPDVQAGGIALLKGIIDYLVNGIYIVTTPSVYNVTLAAADTEYPQALSANTREYRFRCRTLFDVRYAFVTGKVATPIAPYLTLPGGSDYWSDNDKLAATTLYFATDEAGVVVEIEEWV